MNNKTQEVKIDLSFLLQFLMIPAGQKLIAVSAIQTVEPLPTNGGLLIRLTGGHEIKLDGVEAIDFCRNGAGITQQIKMAKAQQGFIG